MLPDYRYAMIAIAVCCAIATRCAVADRNSTFDRDFMNLPATSSGNTPDIDAILEEDSLPAGSYPVSLSINHQDYGQNLLDFTLKDNKLTPCVPVSLLRSAGVRESALASVGSVECVDVNATIAQARVYFDSKKLSLRILIPQASLDLSAQGYINPEKWDEGIHALRLNYSVSGARSMHRSTDSTSANVYLDGGMNLYGFRLRSSASWRKGYAWQSYNSYIERDLPGTLGNIQAGELITGGNVLDSVSFHGVQASSVVQMLPDSLQGYSPVIRGIANSQAKVEISQHGYSLYTTWVPPGPFEIRDLNTVSGNGDLDVTITEADGSIRHFTQPFATLGNLLRQGTWNYNLAVGEYRSPGFAAPLHPRFVQASGAYGLPQDLTLLAGTTISDMYQTALVGIGKGLGRIGAIQLDISQSQTRYPQREISGQSYSLRYGKAFSSGTNLGFAGYRYSTEGYRTFSEAVSERSFIHQNNYQPESRRNRIEVSLTQNVGESGLLDLTANQQSWWHTSHKSRQLRLGYNTSFDWLNLGIYASHTNDSYSYGSRQDSDISLTVSMPLGGTSLSSTINRRQDNRYSENLGLSGTGGDKNQFNYSLNLGHQPQGGGMDYAASGGYLTPLAQLNAGVTGGQHHRSANVGITGSLLAHTGGIELSQRLGDTIGLVEVDRTPGVSLQNAPTAVTNSRGFALVPYLRPYRANRILLDTRNVDNDVDIDGRVQQVYPRQGAVVAVRYSASKNRRLLMQLTRADGSYVPFGASIKDAAGKELTLIGQAGQGLINLPQQAARMSLDVSWGNAPDQRCQAEVVADGLPQSDGISMTTAVCHIPVAGT